MNLADRQARLARTFPEAVEALARAAGLASKERIAEARTLLAPFTTKVAAKLAPMVPEIDGMNEVELLGALIDILRPMFADSVARRPS
jgi:hypothetical protein